MTFSTPSSFHARVTPAPPEHSVALILALLMALVFAPVLGLHLALLASGTGTAAPSQGATAAAHAPKRSRG